MAVALDHAPWRRPDAQREPSDRDVRLAIVAALDAHPGSAQDDVAFLLDMPSTRAAEMRVKRLLDGLVEENEVERWLDHNERPAAWRYWLRGGKPPVPGPRTPLRPKPAAAPATVQEIVQDIPANTVRLSELRGGAPPATAQDGEVDVKPMTFPAGKKKTEPAGPKEPALSDVEREVLAHLNARDAIVRSTELVADLGHRAPGAAVKLAQRGLIQRGGYGKGSWYSKIGVPRPDPKQAEAPVAPAPAREAKPVETGDDELTLRAKMRAHVKSIAPGGMTSSEIAEKWGHAGSKTAHGLVVAGEWRREGKPHHYTYTFVRDPKEQRAPRPASRPRARKRAAPARENVRTATKRVRAKASSPKRGVLDVDALQERIERVRELQAELATLETEIRELAGGA